MARRHSAAVYRRRRLAVVLVALLVAAVIAVATWLVIAQPWARADAGDPSTSPVASPSPSISPMTAPTEQPIEPSDTPVEGAEDTDPNAAPGACRPGDLDVVAVTDAESYPAGVLPQLSISLTNRSAADCTLDVGSSTQVFTVTSGTDVWWRSTDCQQNPSSMVVTLAAGQTVHSAAPVEWDRTRSGVDTCDLPNRPRAPGGGSSYHVRVSIGGVESARSAQILLYGD